MTAPDPAESVDPRTVTTDAVALAAEIRELSRPAQRMAMTLYRLALATGADELAPDVVGDAGSPRAFAELLDGRWLWESGNCLYGLHGWTRARHELRRVES
jgi:hypothetical protein